MVVMGETTLFKASNQLLRKMIYCFEMFETPHTLATPAGQNINIITPFTNNCKCIHNSVMFSI